MIFLGDEREPLHVLMGTYFPRSRPGPDTVVVPKRGLAITRLDKFDDLEQRFSPSSKGHSRTAYTIMVSNKRYNTVDKSFTFTIMF